jgi:hypothetical protein
MLAFHQSGARSRAVAKKRPVTPKKSQPIEDSGTMLVRLELPKETHHRFRVASSKHGRSMANMARRLVEEFLAKEDVAGG